MRTTIVLFVAALTLSSHLSAHSSREHAHAPLPAHEHGRAELQLAVEGGMVELQLRLSGMDAVGFERPPAGEAEREAIAGAIASLEGGAWLSFDAEAACVLEHGEFHTHGFGEKDPAAAEESPSEEHGHAEFHGTLRYACLAPERLRSLAVDLSSRFAAVEALEVTVLGPAGQSRHRLPGGRGRVPLTSR
jgi:hypothetical protein